MKKKHSVGSGVGEPCLQCGRLFKYRANLENHLRVECGVEPTLKCNLCDAKFHFKAHLNEHLLTTHAEVEVGHHKVPSPLSPGGGAGEEFPSGGKYACDLCPRAFTRIGSLNYHVSRKHSGASARDPSVFPFSCNQCNNRYKNSTQLCRHRRWECGKEPMFQCTQCVKKFHHRHGLKQHIRLHIAKSGEEPTALHYCCDKCGKGYKLKSSLNNHTKWECGKEPVFACTICLVKFSHKGNLKKHILTKHIR